MTYPSWHYGMGMTVCLALWLPIGTEKITWPSKATLNGMWVGKSFDRAIEEAKQAMEANAIWGEYADLAMKRAYQNAERRLAQLQVAKAA